MTDPLYPVATIQYKTYLKNALVRALRAVFDGHPDQLIKDTKITIDFPVTETDYPAVVVRFYERSIKNAGVAHYEDRLIEGLTHSEEFWFDNFQNLRTDLDYKVKAGAYVANGQLSNTPRELMPWKGSDFNLNNEGQRAHLHGYRASGENATFRVGLASTLDTSISFIGELVFNGSTATVKIIYRDGAGAETVLGTNSYTAGGASDFWIDFRLEYDGVLHFQVNTLDPFRDQSFISNSVVDATATGPQMASLVEGADQFWVGGTSNGTNSYLKHFRLLRTNRVNQRFYRFKNYLYDGDIEFAVYALSSYDRDLVSDSLVQILAMGELIDWTQPLNEEIYGNGVNPEHFINLNTDEINGFGETQQLAPWMPEDVMVYQTSYRVGVFGQFYSKAPTTGDLGLVERVETYPYMDGVESVPNPNDSGPDHVQGTTDDVTDTGAWTG